MAKEKDNSCGNQTVKPDKKSGAREAGKQMQGGHSAAAKTMANASLSKHQTGRRGGGGGRGR